jgi:predicted nucleic acid-binding protein
VIVLDASALVDVVLDRPWKADVMPHLDQDVLAPGHQLAEVLSSVARLVRANTVTAAVAREALEDAAALNQTHITLTASQLRRALELQDRIRVNDGLYVALAEEHGCPVLTTDRRLAGAQPPCDLIVVGTSPAAPE